ncbi:hypothetical protein GOP47_0018429 [Adiantum capillus-veneris]|uniref:Uncharacterized protein n=1 Tax=Adiantum capillus-veneris TaxID=13818 RepID=A0A9D4UDI7_ADICA|nr:hypothetical protein GOP47_0018429 [Adiantum capillus-veneris]
MQLAELQSKKEEHDILSFHTPVVRFSDTVHQTPVSQEVANQRKVFQNSETGSVVEEMNIPEVLMNIEDQLVLPCGKIDKGECMEIKERKTIDVEMKGSEGEKTLEHGNEKEVDQGVVQPTV